MEFAAALEALPPFAALRRSFVAYALLNAAHIISIGALVTGGFLLDARIIGWLKAQPSQRFVPLMRKVAAGGLGGALITGALLFAAGASEYLENPAFLVKLGLLLTAGLNLAIFHLWLRPGNPEHYPRSARLSAGVSMLLWPGVLIAGRFIGFV